MKRNRKHNILGWLAASALLLTTSCADNADLLQGGGNGANKNTVTFTLRSQMQTGGTRADAEGHDDLPHISDGSKTDVLIFTVYEKDETSGAWKPVEDATKDGANLGDRLGANQNSLAVGDYFPDKDITIQLTLNPEKTYKVAFWAQNETNVAYDTKDLTKVKVNYEYFVNYPDDNGTIQTDIRKYLNNDDFRDAFCTVTKEFLGSESNVTATLRRPFAQINVGTTGWDYEGAAILKPSAVSYTKSKITLKGVAQYYDVLTGKVPEGAETTDVTYEYATIPAAVNVENWNGNYLPFTNEEYLTVDVNKDGIIDDYVSWDEYYAYRTGTTDTAYDGKYKEKYEGKNTKALFDEDKLPATEIYKYLSMCYVLVPEAGPFPAVGNGEGTEESHVGERDGDVTFGSVLKSLTFSAKGIEIKDEPASDDQVETPEVDGTVAKGTSEEAGIGEVFTIYNVPVQKNWRTNILGNIFTINEKFKLDVVPEYMGDYNYDIDGDYPNKPDGSWPGSEEGGWTYSVSFSKDGSSLRKTEKSAKAKEELETSEIKPFFVYEGNQNGQNCTNAVYNGNSYTYGLKMEGSTKIKFKPTTTSTVIIVQATDVGSHRGDAHIVFDGKDYSADSNEAYDDKENNVRIYTIKDVKAGEHTISKSSLPDSSDYTDNPSAPSQACILYIEVQTNIEFLIDIDETMDSNSGLDDDIKDDYYNGNSSDDNPGE